MAGTNLKSQRGQLLIEAILLMVILLLISTQVIKIFKSERLLGSMVSGPWSYISGMMESGVWKLQVQAKGDHPNFNDRQISLQGEQVK